MITNSSASSGYTGASGTYNAGAAARTGVLNTAASGSAYFEFTVTPASGNAVVLTGISFGSRSTSTGPLAYAIRSSLDGYAANIATGTLTNTSAWALYSSTGLSKIGAVGAAVTFRIYGYNGTGTASANTANWRIDDLTVTGSVNGYSSTQCYSLTASTGSTTFRQAVAPTGEYVIYPNPAGNNFRFNAGSNVSRDASILIYDTKGLLVKQQRITAGSQQIDITALPSGLYFASIKNAGVTRIQKFIKE